MIDETANTTPQRPIAEPVGVVDAKGRPLPDTMSDRDLLIETVLTLRAVSDAVGDLAQTPMIRAMQSGSNPLMAMMGR